MITKNVIKMRMRMSIISSIDIEVNAPVFNLFFFK